MDFCQSVAYRGFPSAVYCEGTGTFIFYVTVCCHVTVCVQMAATMEAAILRV